MRMLSLMNNYRTSIAMIGFPNIIESFVSVSELMNIPFSYIAIHHEDEADKVLWKAKADGVKVIVGDTVTVKKAGEHGLQGVLITSGRESVLEAFAQAKNIYKITQTYKRERLMYESMLNHISTGYAAITKTGMIRFANAAFRRLFGL